MDVYGLCHSICWRDRATGFHSNDVESEFNRFKRWVRERYGQLKFDAKAAPDSSIEESGTAMQSEAARKAGRSGPKEGGTAARSKERMRARSSIEESGTATQSEAARKARGSGRVAGGRDARTKERSRAIRRWLSRCALAPRRAGLAVLR